MNAILDLIGYSAWGLHALVWLPLVGMVVVLSSSEERAKDVAFGWSIMLFVLSLGLWWAHEPGTAAFQLASSTPWIPAWGVSYALGVDDVSFGQRTSRGSVRRLAVRGFRPARPNPAWSTRYPVRHRT